MKHIIITLPQKTQWAEYAKELAAVANGKSAINFRVPSLPADSGVGCRCYLVYRGKVVGYMHLTELTKKSGFTCATNGTYWKPGKYLVRSGPFFFFQNPPDMKGFQGWHYYRKSHAEETFIESHNGYSWDEGVKDQPWHSSNLAAPPQIKARK